MEASPVCSVTGASGYVGSRIAERLRQHARVIALARSPRGDGDIPWSLTTQQETAVRLRQEQATVLIHAAWDFSAVTREEIERVNVDGSKRLIASAQEAGIRRVVFISTISAFGRAKSMYGQAKLEVESVVAAMGGVILRPGLVFGTSPGGVFGSIRRQVRGSRFVPLIGDGTAPQYLIPEETLADLVADAAFGRFDRLSGQAITLANPRPWPFRDLVRGIARAEGRNVTLIPVPWRLLYAGLRTAEGLGRKLAFRSDSVISFVYQDPAPDFSALETLGISIPSWPG
jgi:nucleoside-diphosphate-sugar epimerase